METDWLLMGGPYHGRTVRLDAGCMPKYLTYDTFHYVCDGSAYYWCPFPAPVAMQLSEVLLDEA